MAIMKRVEERQNTRTLLPIISAFERGGTMLGYVHVEARKQSDVHTVRDGISNGYPRGKTILVPIKEMSSLLSITNSEELQPGGYVHLERGR